VEARDHVKTFHQLFIYLDPDNKVILANLAKALYLADGSAIVSGNFANMAILFINLPLIPLQAVLVDLLVPG
jgi:hypothetical protein